jgi:hypothetical protein
MTEAPEGTPSVTTDEPTIPDFRADERVCARYAAMIERRKKDFAAEHENSIRRLAWAKRDEIREQLDEAQAEWERRKELAEASREAYREKFPHNVKRTRLIGPSVAENVRSLGAANKLYHAAHESWLALEEAVSNIRRLEHNESLVDGELEKALERAPRESKEITESAKWLAEIHAEEELAEVKARVDEVTAEREQFEQRLSAGAVPADELRLRAFAEQNVKHVALPFEGLIFYRVDRFGSHAYFVMRDLHKQLYALPYDRRLEPLVDGVYDAVRMGKDFEIRRRLREGTRLPLSLIEYFLKCHDGKEDEAQAAFREQQERMSAPRTDETLEPADEVEANVIGLLAAFAEASKKNT